MKKTSVLACIAIVLGLAACGRAGPPAATPPDADAQFARLEHDYVVYFLTRFPVVATYLGGSAFDPALAGIDGKLRAVGPAALADEDARLRDFRGRFAALDPGRLSPRRRIDRDVALAQIDFLLHQHEVRHYQQRALDSYLDEPFRGVDWQIQGMTPTGATTHGTPEEWHRLLERVRAVPDYLAAAQAQLAAGLAAGNTPDWRMLQAGRRIAGDDAEYFAKTLPRLTDSDIAGADRDALRKDIGAAGAQAAAAYLRFRDFLVSAYFDDPAKPDAAALKAPLRADRFALGEQEYDWALRNNLRESKTAAALYEEAWPTVERTRAAMVSLAVQIATRHHWQTAGGEDAVRAVFAKLSEDAPVNDEQMLAWYKETGARLVDYARRTGLFDVPADYRLDVTYTPPPLRSGIDGAAYYPAPPFKKTGVGRFYVTPTGNDRALLRQEHNRAALADLAAHEGFPGHDWNYKVMSQYAEQISPIRWLTPGAVEDSSSMWEDSPAAEGWALYSEALLAEPQPNAPDGFYTPEERLYQLRGQLYRDLRVRIDTGIHTGRLSFGDAVTLYSEVVDFLPGPCAPATAVTTDAKRASCQTAEAAIYRYSRWPTQAITYHLGKDQILALRARAQAALGAKFSLQRFHLEFMRQGSIPVDYFADELLASLQR